MKKRNPLQIAQMPEDHVAAYVLLASDEARAITGEVISSDGGLSVRGLGY
ncbi:MULTISPECIES: SDR family oxidoreductase [Bacillaceae]|nr:MULTISPECIES: SDR family oxidoreductase [Bacillaceae]